MSDAILEAKRRLPLPELLVRLGAFEQVPRPGNYRCPLHREKEGEAFSVSCKAGVWLWNCFGACGRGGDEITFLEAIEGLPRGEAKSRFLTLAGVRAEFSPPSPMRHRDGEVEERARKRATWPAFDAPTRAEVRLIAESRGLSVEGVSLAAERDLLFCADSREGRSWIITDSRRRNAQGRLLSGERWAAGMKAKTLPGSEAAWPIGLREAAPFAAIAFIEGGPDLLTAPHLAWCQGVDDSVAPVAMLGASLSIPAESLEQFAGKRVRIFGHEDAAGRAAAQRWASQLAGAGVDVDGYVFAPLRRADGEPVNDLNDFAHVDPDSWERERGIIEEAFAFERGCPERDLERKEGSSWPE